MSIDNQIEPPQSFMMLFVKPGQTRPNAPQEMILPRYEHCEDMACILAEQAHPLAFKLNLSEKEVLERCHQGLQTGEVQFSEKESVWVVSRLAELLGWVIPDFNRECESCQP
jgi:hypothetical protein